ncbi:MAG: hypothetical protein DMD99_08650 [Candidatus Rokuibacteriota bacterium]|nr:MAG: hypothetical protein DMD99_08650 [Candidatus Rokubacteria bacterium]
MLKELVESGKLRPVIDRTFPLPEVPAALHHLETLFWVLDFVGHRPDRLVQIEARALRDRFALGQLVGIHPRWKHVPGVVYTASSCR